MQITLESRFTAAHLYEQPKWSPQKNTATFGKCFSKHGHGHNYRLVATFHLSTYSSFKKDELQQALDALTEELDHKHLNFVVPDFKKIIPTTENIATYFKNQILKKFPTEKLCVLKLFENDDLWTEIKTESDYE